MQQNILTNFNNAAVSYDIASSLQQQTARGLLSLLQLHFTGRDTFLSMLDVGCGTGYLGRLIIEYFSAAELFSIDFAEEMLRQARDKNELLAFKASSRIHYYCANMAQMPHLKACFDAVVSNFSLHWCPDISSTCEQFYQYLNPGGIFVFAVPGPKTLYELRESWLQVDHWDHVNTFYDLSYWQNQFDQVGFTHINLQQTPIEHHVKNVTELMRTLKRQGVNYIFNRKRKGLVGRKAITKLAAAYEQFRCPEKDFLPVTYEVIWGVVSKPNV